MSEWHADAAPVRRVVHRTRGYALGPITRLVSSEDFGQVIKPFVFLDYFEIDPRRTLDIGFYPHSGTRLRSQRKQRAGNRPRSPRGLK